MEVVHGRGLSDADGDEMLDEDIEGFVHRESGLDLVFIDGIPGSGEFDQFKGMTGNTEEFGRSARLMPGAARSLQETGDSFGASDLDDLGDGRKIDAQVEGRGADDTANGSLAKSLFDLVAFFAIKRSVMHCQLVGPFGFEREKFLEPDLRLRSGIGEKKSGAFAVDPGRDLPNELGADVAGPRKSVDGFGQEGFDLNLLHLGPRDGGGLIGFFSEQHLLGFFRVAQGSRQSPDPEIGKPSA